MADPEIIPPKRASSAASAGRSWPAAYMAWLRDGDEAKALKLLPLVLVGVVPASVLDDFVLPGIGLIDNVPTALLVVVVAFLTWMRVKKYR